MEEKDKFKPSKKSADTMKKEERAGKSKLPKIIGAIVLILIIAIIGGVIFLNTPKKTNTDKVGLIINNNNVSLKVKKEVYRDEQGQVYLSLDDVKNYFDKYIMYEDNKLVTTFDTRLAIMEKGQKEIEINGTKIGLSNALLEKDGTIYIPFSDLSENVYNAQLTYIESTNMVVLDSFNREYKTADCSKNMVVKGSPKFLSRAVDKVKKGEKVVYISSKDGWAKIRTQNGKIGYIKEKDASNIYTVRQDMNNENVVNEKICLVWDYYSEYAKAPNREGTEIQSVNVVSPAFFSMNKDASGNILDNAKAAGKEYIKWAKQNDYKVWPMLSNSSLKASETSAILNDFDRRKKLVEDIVNLVRTYDIDGINLDFENMKAADKDVYSRLVIELAPRLKDMGKTLSVDVTAPDGAENWSLCFDRHVIGDVADYLVFMAYDQYGASSPKEGTTAGYNWIETNLNKFVGTQEDVDSKKIILGVPFYTRLWEESGDSSPKSKTVNIKDVDKVLPTSAERIWNDDLKQDYVEYQENGKVYKMWVEDEKSIKEKLGLIKKYDLAGAAFWEKDREQNEIWQMIDEELNN